MSWIEITLVQHIFFFPTTVMRMLFHWHEVIAEKPGILSLCRRESVFPVFWAKHLEIYLKEKGVDKVLTITWWRKVSTSPRGRGAGNHLGTWDPDLGTMLKRQPAWIFPHERLHSGLEVKSNASENVGWAVPNRPASCSQVSHLPDLVAFRSSTRILQPMPFAASLFL